MPTLEGAFKLRDEASAALIKMRFEAGRTDTAFMKLGATMDAVSSSRRAQNITTVGRATRQLGTDAGNAATRIDRMGRAVGNADRNTGNWSLRLRTLGRGLASFGRELAPFARPAGMLYGFGTLAGLAGQAVGQLAGGVVALTPRLLDMGSALAAAIPAYAGFAGAMLTLKTVSKDIGTALGGGRAGAQALREMGQAGAQVVRQLRAMRFELRNLEQSATRPVYQGIRSALPMVRGAMPQLRGIAGSVGGALGSLIPQASATLTGGGTLKDLGSLAGSGSQMFLSFGRAAITLAHALIGVGAAAGPLGRWIAQGVQHFANWVDKTVAAGRASGQLQAHFERLRMELSQTFKFLGNVGHVLMRVFNDARPAGEMLYRSLLGASTAWRAMSDNTSRNIRLTHDFMVMAQGFQGIAKLLGVITSTLFKMGTGTGLPAVTASLTKMVPVLGQILTNMANTFGPTLANLLGNVSKLFTLLGGPEGPMVTVLKVVNALVSGINHLVGAFGPLKGVITTALEVGLILRFASKLGLLTLGWRSVAVAAGQAAVAEQAAAMAGGGMGGLPIGLGPRLGGLRGFRGALSRFRGAPLRAATAEGQMVAEGANGWEIAAGAGGLSKMGMLGGAARAGLGLAGRLALPLALFGGGLGAFSANRWGSAGNQIGQTLWGGANGLTGGLAGGLLHQFGVTTPDQMQSPQAIAQRNEQLRQETAARKAVIDQLHMEQRTRGAGRGNAIVSGLNRVYRQAGGGAAGLRAGTAAGFGQLRRYGGSGASALGTRDTIEAALMQGDPSSAASIIAFEAAHGRRIRASGGRLFHGGLAELQGLKQNITLPGSNKAVLGSAILASLQASGLSPRAAATDMQVFKASGYKGSLLTNEQRWAIECALAAVEMQKRMKGGSAQFVSTIATATATAQAARRPAGFHASGGRIGGVGVHDTVPVGGMAAPGELIVNRHTERKANYLLGQHGLSLGGLVGGETTPHSARYAAGGRLAGVHPGIARIAGAVLGKFPGLQVTSTTGGGHANGSYHYMGEAVDLAGSSGLMNRAGGWIQANLGSQLLEGIHNSSLSVKNGRPASNMFWGKKTWGEHLNHIHLAAGDGATGVSGAATQAGKSGPGKPGGTSVGSIFNTGSDFMGLGGIKINPGMSSKSTNTATGAGAGAPAAGGGSYSKASLMGLAQSVGFPPSALNMAGAIAMAESHGNPNARNVNTNGSIDRGLWQINSIHGAQSVFDPVANARSAYQISRGGTSWGPWSTFNNGAYKQFLQTGGRARRWGGWHAGGLDATFDSPTVIGVGENGKEHVTVTPHGKGGKGGAVTFHNYFTIHGGEPGRVQAEITHALELFADQLDRHYGSDVGGAAGSAV